MIDQSTASPHRWSHPGIPHTGWTCIEVSDGKPMDAEHDNCEMCGNEELRWIHHMHHPEYPETLLVGCICAGNMEGDVAKAKARAGRMKGHAAKRTRFSLSMRDWRRTKKGGWMVKRAGTTIVLFQTATKLFGFVDMNTRKFSPRNYATEAEAKAALYDMLYPMKALVADPLPEPPKTPRTVQ